ncbi:MAG: hypothetical protein AB7P76_05720 [Candidatus Melainabacteria bacterium]
MDPADTPTHYPVRRIDYPDCTALERRNTDGTWRVKRIDWPEPLPLVSAIMSYLGKSHKDYREPDDATPWLRHQMLEPLAVIHRHLEKPCPLGETPVRALLGGGLHAQAFLTAEDDPEVLKIGVTPLVTRRLDPDMDAPVLSIGSLEGVDPKGLTVKQRERFDGQIHFYRQKPAVTDGVTPAHVSQIYNLALEKGYRPCPTELGRTRTDQIGLYDGEPRLLDPECVTIPRPRTPRLPQLSRVFARHR